MKPAEREELRKAALLARQRGEIVINESQSQTRRRTFDSPAQRDEHLRKMNLNRVKRFRTRHSGV